MRDLRPLSDRFDLMYVRKKHFADRWGGRLGMLAAAGTALVLGGMYATGNERGYTAGELTQAHDMFATDCTKCHDAGADKALGGLLLPASDAKCLECHDSQATAHARNQVERFLGASVPGHEGVMLSANCAACHVEHRGRHANLSEVSDNLCVSCHSDLKSSGIRKGASPGEMWGVPSTTPSQPPVAKAAEPAASPAQDPAPGGTDEAAKAGAEGGVK